MLVVLMVLLMTTATATMAIHATSMEIRSAGHSRQALQAEYLAEGSTYAALSYLEVLRANGALVQYLRTTVAAGVSTGPGEVTMDYGTNLFRIRMQDFTPTSAAGVRGLPVETRATAVPSMGPRNAYQPDFEIGGTDLYQLARDDAGRDLTGRGAQYFRMTLTSRATMAPPGDYRAADDSRSFNEVAMRARTIAEVGPYWIGGH
jgi:hypothetical protein